MTAVFVEGVPKAQPRHRLTTRGGFPRLYDPETARPWKEAVELAFSRKHNGDPVDGPMRLVVTYVMPRPKALNDGGRELHAKKPDIDNLNKAVMDAISRAGVWKDDSRVAETYARKVYAATGESTGAYITIHSI